MFITCVSGDFNARTGDLEDTIEPDKFDDLFHIDSNNTPINRNSEDKHSNERGKELLEMCKSLQLYIANGRKVGDPFGNLTCFQWNGSSVVDYLISSMDIFDQIPFFKVGEYLPLLSNHTPLYFVLEIKKCVERGKSLQPTKKAPTQFLWSSESVEKYTNALKNVENTNKLEYALNLDYTKPNIVTDYLTTTLIQAAESSRIKKSVAKK